MNGLERQYHLSEAELIEQQETLAHQQWLYDLAAEQNWEPPVRRLSDYKRAWWKAARSYLFQKRCMAYWAKDNFGGMDEFKEARTLDFRRQCLDKAACELRGAIEEIKRKAVADGSL